MDTVWTARIFLFLLIAVYFIGRKSSFQRIRFGIVAFLASIGLGIATQTLHKQTYRKNHYIHIIQDEETACQIEVKVTEKLKKTVKNNRYIVKINTIDGKKSYGKAILNISAKDTANFKNGSLLRINGKFYKNKPAFNPNQFDYGKYLERQEIYAQIYTQKKDLKIIGSETSVWSFFSNYREKLIANVEKSQLPQKELSVFVALLLGQQQDISPDVLRDYQYSGAVHILSVSGLHVGIIMLFINFLLKPVPNTKKGSLLKMVLIILALWSFATLAVCRLRWFVPQRCSAFLPSGIIYVVKSIFIILCWFRCL